MKVIQEQQCHLLNEILGHSVYIHNICKRRDYIKYDWNEQKTKAVKKSTFLESCMHGSVLEQSNTKLWDLP